MTKRPAPTVGTKLVFKTGEFITREEESSTEWFILGSGSIGVFKQNIQIDEFSKPGTIFGELSSILTIPRTASLQALGDSEVLCVASTLDDLIKSHPDIAKKLIVSLAERLVRTTNIMVAHFADGSGEE